MLGGGNGNARAGAAPGGGLGDILGGLLGGGAAGSVLNGGLKHLLEDMEANGQGDAVKSWVGTGENRSISETDLANAVGLDDIDAVARQTGMPRQQLLAELSDHLPQFVDQLTPKGRLPTDREAARWGVSGGYAALPAPITPPSFAGAPGSKRASLIASIERSTALHSFATSTPAAVAGPISAALAPAASVDWKPAR